MTGSLFLTDKTDILAIVIKYVSERNIN